MFVFYKCEVLFFVHLIWKLSLKISFKDSFVTNLIDLSPS
jgi:hypothetical protein